MSGKTGRPIYTEIANDIRSQIHSGSLQPGDRLPSESEMIATYSVSRMTVRGALDVLRHEGLIVKQHGRGSFVGDRPPGTRRWSAREAPRMHIIEVRNAELLSALTHEADELGVRNASIGALIGAVDSFTVSTMPADDAKADVLTDYDQPAEMTATGEIVNGEVHVHAVMAIEGDKAIAGHLHRAQVGTWFARAYILPVGPGSQVDTR